VCVIEPHVNMTEESARKIADVVLGVAAIGVAIYIVKTPPLRRMAWRLAVTTLTGAAPVWFRNELQRAWAESGQVRPGGPALT
jgi:hypothetical protein